MVPLYFVLPWDLLNPWIVPRPPQEKIYSQLDESQNDARVAMQRCSAAIITSGGVAHELRSLVCLGFSVKPRGYCDRGFCTPKMGSANSFTWQQGFSAAVINWKQGGKHWLLEGDGVCRTDSTSQVGVFSHHDSGLRPSAHQLLSLPWPHQSSPPPRNAPLSPPNCELTEPGAGGTLMGAPASATVPSGAFVAADAAPPADG